MHPISRSLAAFLKLPATHNTVISRYPSAKRISDEPIFSSGKRQASLSPLQIFTMRRHMPRPQIREVKKD